MTKTLRLPPTMVLPLDDIKPYWRNPRRITEEAVGMLARSINEFDYQQPIVVDSDNVIVIGHTRYAAMRRLGYTEAPVLVVGDLSAAKVKELRIHDNRAAEYTSWDYDLLMGELSEMDKVAREAFFPDIELDGDNPQPGYVAEQEYSEAEDEENPNLVNFVCPSCYHSWDVVVTERHIMTGVIKEDQE